MLAEPAGTHLQAPAAPGRFSAQLPQHGLTAAARAARPAPPGLQRRSVKPLHCLSAPFCSAVYHIITESHISVVGSQGVREHKRHVGGLSPYFLHLGPSRRAVRSPIRQPAPRAEAPFYRASSEAPCFWFRSPGTGGRRHRRPAAPVARVWGRGRTPVTDARRCGATCLPSKRRKGISAISADARAGLPERHHVVAHRCWLIVRLTASFREPKTTLSDNVSEKLRYLSSYFTSLLHYNAR